MNYKEKKQMFDAEGCIEVMCKDTCKNLVGRTYCKEFKTKVNPTLHRFCSRVKHF